MNVAHKVPRLDDCTHTNAVVNQIMLLNGLSSNDINAIRIMCITDNFVSFIQLYPHKFSLLVFMCSLLYKHFCIPRKVAFALPHCAI